MWLYRLADLAAAACSRAAALPSTLRNAPSTMLSPSPNAPSIPPPSLQASPWQHSRSAVSIDSPERTTLTPQSPEQNSTPT